MSGGGGPETSFMARLYQPDLENSSGGFVSTGPLSCGRPCFADRVGPDRAAERPMPAPSLGFASSKARRAGLSIDVPPAHGRPQGSPYIALASAIRWTGFSMMGRLTSADRTPNRIDSHHTTS